MISKVVDVICQLKYLQPNFLTEDFNETLIQGCFICLKYANHGHLPRWNCRDSENLAKIPQNIFFMILSVNIGTN